MWPQQWRLSTKDGKTSENKALTDSAIPVHDWVLQFKDSDGKWDLLSTLHLYNTVVVWLASVLCSINQSALPTVRWMRGNTSHRLIIVFSTEWILCLLRGQSGEGWLTPWAPLNPTHPHPPTDTAMHVSKEFQFALNCHRQPWRSRWGYKTFPLFCHHLAREGPVLLYHTLTVHWWDLCCWMWERWNVSCVIFFLVTLIFLHIISEGNTFLSLFPSTDLKAQKSNDPW